MGAGGLPSGASGDTLDARGPSLDALAESLGARLICPEGAPRDLRVSAVRPLETASAEHLAAAFEPRHRAAARHTAAGVVLVGPDAIELPDLTIRLLCDDPRLAFGQALRLLHGPAHLRPPPVGCDPRAAIDASAQVDPTARIGPFVVVGPGCRVAAGAILFAGVYLGAEVVVGAHSQVLPGARILDGCTLGARVHIGANAVIGGPGFGLDAEGRVPQLGGVVLGDDVWVGALCCVDRGTLSDTVIEAGAQLDNLVQVGHNAHIGVRAILCGQVGLAGGAVVGAGAVLGGQAGVAGHRTVGARAKVAAQSGVTRNLPEGGSYSGHPAEPNRQRLRRLAVLRRVADRGPIL